MPELSAPRWVQSRIYAFGPILLRVVARVERALLQEVSEWHSLPSLSEPIEPGRGRVAPAQRCFSRRSAAVIATGSHTSGL